VACSDFAGLEDFASDLGSVRAALSRAPVLGTVGRAAACSDSAGLEVFCSDFDSFRLEFSCGARSGPAGRPAACSLGCSAAGLDDALVSDLGSAFVVPLWATGPWATGAWATGAGVLSARAGLAFSVLDGLAPALTAFPFFVLPRFAAVLV
jgi:hypothetical protein